jgi:transcriptional regulator with XRE-family HTH domain
MMEVIIDGVRYLPECRHAPTELTSFSVLIANAREDKKETLDEASSNIGIAKSQLWSMEKGETEPKLKMLKKVLRYYGLSFDQIGDA